MRYPGGKGRCYPQLINLMPPHSTYVETHLGGGAVMRKKKPASHQIGIEIDPLVVEKWRQSEHLTFELLHADAVSWLGAQQLESDTLIYADPPYLASTRKRDRVYPFDYTERDHEALLDALMNQRCQVMISGYRSGLYDARLRGWNQRSFLSKAHDGLREETVWFNFEVPERLHDASLIGGTFREREKLGRRRARLEKRIASLSSPEQHALFDWLQQRLEKSA